MNRNNFVNITMVFVCLAVIGWGLFLVVDYLKISNNDHRRIALIQKLQASLEEYHQKYQYYPGTPFYGADNQIVYADWHYLMTVWGKSRKDLVVNTAEPKDYYDFSDFKDPCEPNKTVGISGVVECPSKEVKYGYLGVDCSLDKIGCQGYKIILDSENTGRIIFTSKSSSNE